MKRVKVLFIGLTFVMASLVPILFAGSASASSDVLQCGGHVFTNDNVNLDDAELPAPAPLCDLALTKQVSVNGGAFEDADTSATAASAQVGDTLTWKILITNNSTSFLIPDGTVTIEDVLPTNVSLNTDGAVASFGDYTDNVWTLKLTEEGSNLPATLLLTTTATSAGLFKNTATLQDYTCPQEECVDPPYADGLPTNNTNDAWVNIQTKPKVLGTSTTTDPASLVNTGNGAALNIAIGALMLLSLAVVSRGRLYRKRTHYRA